MAVARNGIDMNYEKALNLYRNDKALQFLRAEQFPLLAGFLHLAFKERERISYPQSELQSLLSDYLYMLQRQGVTEHDNPPAFYLTKWSQLGYLRRYYETSDEPVFELSPATESALKWLHDIERSAFVGTHSRLRQFFGLLKQIAYGVSTPMEQIRSLEAERDAIESRIEALRRGEVEPVNETQLREDYLLAEETARELLSDFRQVEENFRTLDTEMRHRIIRSGLAKGELLDEVFSRQDHLQSTDQGKSFNAFWEFLMSDQMQGELEEHLERITSLPALRTFRRQMLIDRIKGRLVDAGDKVNRTNDGLITQLRRFVEQSNLATSRHILRSMERIEQWLTRVPEAFQHEPCWMELDAPVRIGLPMERPLFEPPHRVGFVHGEVLEGITSEAGLSDLLSVFHVDIELLRSNVRKQLSMRPQVTLRDITEAIPPEKGMAELIGYLQIATEEPKHIIDRQTMTDMEVPHPASGTRYRVRAPQVIFNR